MVEDNSAMRLYPCFLLRDRKIPCCVWLEDAVKYHGANTVLFNLHILVKDLDEAAQVLTEKGWSLVERDPSKWDIGVDQTVISYLHKTFLTETLLIPLNHYLHRPRSWDQQQRYSSKPRIGI